MQLSAPWLEECETLYSWCATLHSMSASPSTEGSSLAILGRRHASRQHDIPASIGWIRAIGLSDLMPTFEVARRHTIAAYYAPFLPPVRLAEFEHQWEFGCTGRVRSLMEGTSRTFPIEHPLKWCERCLAYDQEIIGRGYWHVDHQFPTTWVCAVHGISLCWISGRHKRWLLPAACAQKQYQVFDATKYEPSLQLLSALGIAASQTSSVAPASLRSATIRRLQEIGVIQSNRGTRHESLQNWFRSTAVGGLLRELPCGLSRLADGAWIAPQLWRQRRSHAVRWIVLWAALGWSDMTSSCDAYNCAAAGLLSDDKGQAELFFDFPSPTSTPAHVVEAFASFSSYATVMAALSVSRHQVVRWLENDAALRRTWRAKLTQCRRDEALHTIRRAYALDPVMGYGEMMQTFSSDIRWLRSINCAEIENLLQAMPYRAKRQRSLF